MTKARVGLLERAEALEELEQLMAGAGAGRGSVVVVEGPAGIGKTSLLAMTRTLGQRHGLRVLAARAGLLERELAWSVVRQLFGAVIRSGEERPADLLAGAGSLARPALGLAGAVAGADESGALHGLYWVTTTLSERAPLLLAIDDAHWGDVASLRALAYIGERASDLPLLLVVTVRTGEPMDAALRALRLGRETRVITLSPLSADASAELTRETLGAGASSEFCMACHAAAGGNPFLLTELLRQLQRDQVTPTAQSAAEVARITPESVTRSVLLRLSVLRGAAQQLARALAVLGGEAELIEAAAVAKLEPEAAASAADALSNAGILAPGARLSFAHPLVSEVIYKELSEHERGQRHRAAARALAGLGRAPQRVATQLLQAPSLGDEWVVAQLREAARAALADGAPQPAVDFLRRSLQEPPPARLRVTVLREVAGAEALGDSAAAIDHLEQALAAVSDQRERAEIGRELIMILVRHGQNQRGVELSHEVLANLPPDARALELGVIATAVVGAVLVPALHPHVDELLHRIPDDLPGQTSEERLALSARVAVAVTRDSPMAELADLAERALAGGRLLDDLPSHDLLYWNAASAVVIADRFDVARTAIEAALEQARRAGSIVGFALSSCIRCLLDYRVGNVTEGALDGRQALDASAVGEIQVRAYAVAFLIDCLIERGEIDAALALAEAPEFAGELPDLFVFHLLRVARARSRIEAGDHARGVQELHEVGATMGLGRFSPAACPWRARAAVGLSALGYGAEARELAEEELSLARKTGSGWAEVIALQALAAASASGVELLEEARDKAERCGFALERARALVALGALQRRSGRRNAAVELLQLGLDQSISCGALALEQRARTELAATGLRPRRRQLTGVDALTPGERRVAALAAEGMTNREIAQSLFVSLRTVETHLTHTYQKLGIGSRAELEHALLEVAPVRN